MNETICRKSDKTNVLKTVACALRALLLSWTTTAHADSNVSGRVNLVNVNSDWGGFMVELNNGAQFTEPGCPTNWAFMPRTDPMYKEMLATLMAAKLSGDNVWVFTRGCYLGGLFPIPQIVIVDPGVRY
jgi:hypothetical protein